MCWEKKILKLAFCFGVPWQCMLPHCVVIVYVIDVIVHLHDILCSLPAADLTFQMQSCMIPYCVKEMTSVVLVPCSLNFVVAPERVLQSGTNLKIILSGEEWMQTRKSHWLAGDTFS